MQRYGFNFILNNPGSSQTSGGILGPGQVSSGTVSGGVLTSTLADAFGIVVSDASSHITALLSMLEGNGLRSEEHTSELQSLMRISYAVFCLKKKKTKN